jgi:hypothetical protein
LCCWTSRLFPEYQHVFGAREIHANPTSFTAFFACDTSSCMWNTVNTISYKVNEGIVNLKNDDSVRKPPTIRCKQLIRRAIDARVSYNTYSYDIQ